MLRRLWLGGALAVGAAACATLVGLDEDYVVAPGETASAGSAPVGGAGGAPTGTGGLGGSGGDGAGGGDGGSGGTPTTDPPELPVNLRQVLLHLDAYDAGRFELGTPPQVARWRDRSGAQQDFVFPDGQRGTFVGGGRSPDNYYDNEGVGMPEPLQFTTEANEFTFVAWVDPTETGYHCVYDNHGSTPMLWYDPTDGWEVDIADLGSVPDPFGAFGSVAVAHRTTGSQKREIYVDGVSQLSSSQESYSGTTFEVTWLRRHGWDVEISAAKWKELLLYDRGLVVAEIHELQTYFVEKWTAQAR